MFLPILRRKKKAPPTSCFGILAEYADGEALLHAIHVSKAAGYDHMEAYTPMPMHEVWHAIGHKSSLPVLVFFGGLFGGSAGFFMQYFASVIHYPLNIAGRPTNSWPSFIVITFEMTILFAALSAVFGMLALNGLPRPHHPVFEIPEFEQASQNRFFLLVLARDPRFEYERVAALLADTKPLSLSEVPNP